MEEKRFKTFGELYYDDMLFVFNEDDLQIYKTVFESYPYKNDLRGYDYVQRIYGTESVEIVATNLSTLIEYASDRLHDKIRKEEKTIKNYKDEIVKLKRNIDYSHSVIETYKNYIESIESSYDKELKEKNQIEIINDASSVD